MDDDLRGLVEDLDACAVACEEVFQRLRAEHRADGLGELERDLLLTAAVVRTACGEAGAARFEPDALAHLLEVGAELCERTAAELAAGDDGLAACREACLAAAAAARGLSPRTLRNGYG